MAEEDADSGGGQQPAAQKPRREERREDGHLCQKQNIHDTFNMVDGERI